MKDISGKTNHVLKIILLVFFIILFRVWHLEVIQKSEKQKESKKPQIRTIILPATRGCIYDRFKEPLALNRIKYDAAVYYSHIRQIPQVVWEKDENQKPIKKYKRKEYIKELSNLLAQELNLDSNRIEDLIHSKASLLGHIPFVIKENISEKEYFKLRMLQRSWIGIYAQISQERFYPQKEIAGSLLGYMGAISPHEYLSIAEETKQLQDFLLKFENNENPPLPEEFDSVEAIENRLSELKKRAYSITDLIGKAGIESAFDERLKGFHEKKSFAVDIKGNYLKDTSESKKPTPGETLHLTISSELQAFAEELLAKDEKSRDGKSYIYDPQKKKMIKLKQPWIKGGSIIAMDPNNGEILALASFPGFDPNDFSQTKSQPKLINKWLETPPYIANIWNGKDKFYKKLFNQTGYYIEEKPLTWQFFLDLILPSDGPFYSAMDKINNLKTAIDLQENIFSLLYFSNQKDPASLIDALYPQEEGHILAKNHENDLMLINKALQKNKNDVFAIKRKIDPFFQNIFDNKDKLLLIDLCKLSVNNFAFSDELIQKKGSLTLSEYFDLSRSVLRIKSLLYSKMKPLFHNTDFQKWKNENQITFLKQKRDEEKEKKTFARPYIDYFDNMENTLFQEFWQKNQNLFVLTLLNETTEQNPYTTYLTNIKDQILKICLQDLDKLKKEVADLSSNLAFEFIKSIRSFSELDRPLLFSYSSIAKTKDFPTEKDLAASFYPKGGFGYVKSYGVSHQSSPGSVFKLVTAYAALLKRYQDLKLESPTIAHLNPLTMIDDFYAGPSGELIVGKTLEGRPYNRFYKGGRLPKSAHAQIGKIDLSKALEQSSNPYFAILSGDYLNKPEDLITAAYNFGLGHRTDIDLPKELIGNLPTDIDQNKTGLYSLSIGHHTLLVTPIQLAVMLSAIANSGKVLKPKLIKDSTSETLNEVELPSSIRKAILHGMDLVVNGENGSARGSIIKKIAKNPTLLEEYKNISPCMVGKTGTAEFTFKSDIVPSSKAKMYKNIWFGSIAFEDSNEGKWNKPELVVVVFLPFGDFGKEAAPLAAQVIKKYKEIKSKKASL
ncbi:MAG: hypothetical protein HZB76_01115 [Chlamydiae bacterium]|nr:hypothetical protein [Chlamydiota bacterium]